MDTVAQSFDSGHDALFDRKLETVTEGLPTGFLGLLHKLSRENSMTIARYITSVRAETNCSVQYRRDIIVFLGRLSTFFQNKKSFSSITRSDLLSFLDSLRKPESVDPMHRWIGTYNTYLVHLMRFLKWLYYPGIPAKTRPRPAVIENISRLKRKEISIYKPTDLWSEDEDLLFLKYCPSKRMKCYHSASRDTSCRPSELLRLKIRDIVFKKSGTFQYAEVLVNGKTGARNIPLFNSIPYLKDYLDHEHPQPANPNSPLFCGIGRSLGRPIQPGSLSRLYMRY